MKARVKKRTVRHAPRHYTAILERDTPGYHAFCPALPGCCAQGETLDGAMQNLRRAARSYCKKLRDEGKPLPEEKIIITSVAYRSGSARAQGATSQ